jgi:TPR repeat protein
VRFPILILAVLAPLLAEAEPIGPPPALVSTVEAPQGYPEVPTEPHLVAVETLRKDELRALVAAGRADAAIQLARLLWMDGDRFTPIQLLKEPAESGVPVAQYLLGTYLRFSKGEQARSMKLIQEAARQGHAIGQETLAGYYERGTNGLEKSDVEAFRLYLAAGRQGLRHSQSRVGMFLCTGRGVEEDQATGKAWFLNSQKDQRMQFSPRAAGCE